MRCAHSRGRVPQIPGASLAAGGKEHGEAAEESAGLRAPARLTATHASYSARGGLARGYFI